MADGNEDLTLRDLFREIQQQRTEVHQLRDEVKGNSETVASEVKKLKTVQDIKWKFQVREKPRVDKKRICIEK